MFYRRLFMFAALNALALSPQIAQAQTAPSAAPAAPATDEPAALDEIVVTARRVAENLQDVPLAVSALSGQALSSRAVSEIRNLNAAVPNLQIETSNSGGSAIVVSIRGQVPASSGLLYVDPAVGVYVDGLNVPRNSGLRSGLVDIERVEVLRGPQGTLYGRNTTGGAMSIITKDPKDEFGASLQASYGNYDAYNLLGVFNLPIAEGVGLRIVGQHGAHDAYGREVLTGRGLYDETSSYLRGKLKVERGPLTMALTGDYFHYRSSGPIQHLAGLIPGTPVAGGFATQIARTSLGLPNTAAGLAQAEAVLRGYVRRGPGAAPGIDFHDTFGTNSGRFGNFALPLSSADSEGASFVLNIDYELAEGLVARSISGYRRTDRFDKYDIDGTPLSLLETNNTTPFDNFYSQELQLLGGQDRLTWVLGGYYSYERGVDFTPSISVQVPPSAAFGLADGRTTNIGKAVFGQASYEVTDALKLTLGARYTEEIRKIRNRNRSSAGACLIPVALINDPDGPVLTRANGTVGPCGALLSAKFTNPSWLASVDYKINPDVMVYAKFATGFRGGGQQGRANTPTVIDTFRPFAPEKVTEYEAGLKSELFSRLLQFNLAAFYDDYTDVQRTVTSINEFGQSFSAFSNAADARIWGVEGEATLRVSREFRLSGNVGYLNAKYKNFQDRLVGDRSAEPFPAPKWTYSLNAAYTRPMDFGLVNANLQWQYKGTTNLQPQTIADDQVIQKGYGLLNGSLSLALESGFEVGVFGRNLLGKDYYAGGTSLDALGFNTLYVGEPRTYGLQVTKRLGGER
jgi:iron complex outermembrane receptor protein